MDLVLLTVIGITIVALLFDYANGFHDSANSISTIVATRVLQRRGDDGRTIVQDDGRGLA